jgi:NhaP-type Na+/H+ or K+/H+ antiporter
MIELAGIVILGILAQWVAWRTRLPAILPLIIIGLVVGPISTLWTADGMKLIEPVFDPETGRGLFPSEQMFFFVSLSIAVILFEGGLTLNRSEVKGVGPTIVNLITLGSVVTFIGAAMASHFIMGLSWQISFLFSALIIVTGPTVIAPILRNIPLKRSVSAVLKWEGILIDPIGALVAVLVFELIISGADGQEITRQAITTFLRILLIGFASGLIAAYFLYYLIKKEFIPHYLLNVFTLALVLAVFVLDEALEHESGLLSVVIMGMVLGNMNLPKLKEILDFKESLSVLLISILFIVLSANIDLSHLELLYDWRCLAVFLVVILLLRPLGVWLSTWRSALTWNEKAFISWVGPRGIVAAGIASLFGLRLVDRVEGAEYITPLVFMIVLGTVLLNATTARGLAHVLKVTLERSEGVFVVGANIVARLLSQYLQENGRHVVMVDYNKSSIQKAKEAGLEAIFANIYTDDLEDNFDLLDMGYLLAMTSSPEVNKFAFEKYMKVFGEEGAYRVLDPDEVKQDKSALPEKGIFLYTDDYQRLLEAAQDFPQINERAVQNAAEFVELCTRLSDRPKSIPLFHKRPDGRLEPIPANPEALSELTEGSLLVYLGEPFPNG